MSSTPLHASSSSDNQNPDEEDEHLTRLTALQSPAPFNTSSTPLTKSSSSSRLKTASATKGTVDDDIALGMGMIGDMSVTNSPSAVSSSSRVSNGGANNSASRRRR